jgi:hypothetical protein
MDLVGSWSLRQGINTLPRLSGNMVMLRSKRLSITLGLVRVLVGCSGMTDTEKRILEKRRGAAHPRRERELPHLNG